MKRGGLLDEVQDSRGKKDVDDSQFKEDHPTEFHHLVIAETRKRPPNPDEEEGEKEEFEYIGDKLADNGHPVCYVFVKPAVQPKTNGPTA